MEFATLLLQGKKTIPAIHIGCATLTAIAVYLVMKLTYTGEAMFLLPQSSPGSRMSEFASSFILFAPSALIFAFSEPG